jgi:putative iron-regulated protein
MKLLSTLKKCAACFLLFLCFIFNKKLIMASFALAILFSACKKNKPPVVTPGLSTDQQSQVVLNYSNILEAGYQDSYNAALTLQTKINVFIASPTAQGLTDAQNAWLAAREPICKRK